MWLFYYFSFESNYDILKSKRPCILLKNVNCNKSETESKMENPTHSFRQTSPVLELIQESQFKSKTAMSWGLRKKKEGIFVPFILSKGSLFKICVLSQYIVYWIHFQNIDTSTYNKAFLLTLLCLFLKSLKAFSVSLIHISIIILRHVLYLLYLCPCLNLGLCGIYVYLFHFHLHFHYD